MAQAGERGSSIRLGQIAFLNCFPLNWALERVDHDGLVIEPTLGPPDVLSEQLIAGELDLAPVTLVEAARAGDRIVVLPEHVIAADGPVASVILVSRTPWEALDGARVVLGSDSRTGVALAQVLLSERVGVTPSVFVRGTGDVADVLRSADAYVLIGDQALRHVRADSRSDLPDGPTTFTYDLAGEWRAWTGLPATFAVWAASARFAREQPEALARARQVLGRAREYAAASSAQVADAATARTDPPIVDLAGYFAGLIYRSNESVVAGANALLAKLGLPAVRPVADL